ncbi:MAG: DsrE family protein [bacterium]
MPKQVTGFPSFLVIALLLICHGPAIANPEVDQIVASDDPPSGIVFEIVDGEDDALDWAIPLVVKLVNQVRAKHPDMDIAVVSHGTEQFALQRQHQDDIPEIHQQIKTLRKDDIPLHICETHASWFGVDASDFPAHIDVAPSGPAQINQYVDLGYQLIKLDQP